MENERVHNIFYDNGIYKKLTAKGNEDHAVNQYDSLIQYVPSLDNGLYRTYFTWSSLLEAIGLGNFRKKYKPRLSLRQFYIDGNDQNKQGLVEAYNHSYQYFLNHSELSVSKLKSRIQEQITYSSSKATEKLVEDTLGRYLSSFLSSPDKRSESMAHYLAWDAVCECPFANFCEISDQEQVLIRKKVRKINELLLRIFHDKYCEGIDLSSYRLADKIQKELLSSSEYLDPFEKKDGCGKSQIKIPNLLENMKDLGDADVIHFATFGLDGHPGIVITSDKPEVIRQRLIIQLSVMRFLCKAEESKLKMAHGLVLFADSESGTIYDYLDVKALRKDAHINLMVFELPCKPKDIL